MQYSTSVKNIAKRVVPDSILFRVSPVVVKIYSRFWTWYRYGRHHQATIPPFRLLKIDPATVDYRLYGGGKFFTESDVISEVVDGPWDEEIMKVNDYDLHNALVKRIQTDIAWEQTEFYQRVRKRYNSRDDYGKWGCSTFEEFEDRLTELDELWKSIDQVGFKTQRELRRSQVKVPAERRIHSFWPPELNEIAICIGRDGELILYDGRHRFAIARGLELKQIPVRVRGRHSNWQELRDRIATGEYSEADQDGRRVSNIFDHPDIQYK